MTIRQYEWLEALFVLLEAHADFRNAREMGAYMKGRFVFYGIHTPLRRKLAKDALNGSSKLDNGALWRVVEMLYAQPHRECQYIALDMLNRNYKRFTPPDVDRMTALIDRLAWWDSVDALRKPISLWLLAHSERLPVYMERLLTQESFWQRRVAITLQLGWKAQTDRHWLETAIVRNLHDGEFFIQKGIGWALRDYAKTDADWVRRLFGRHDFSALARREGMKRLDG